MTALIAIQDEVKQLKLDDSLLALNHFLSASRQLTSDPSLERKMGELKFRPPAYIVHFLAKQVLLHASTFGHATLTWPRFVRLMDLCISLDDPIQHDPNWKEADPNGFFERILSQQIPPQAIRPLQRYGLALGLFRDVGVVEWPEKYDLRAEVESEVGLTVEQFITMGFVCHSFQQASHQAHKCMATFTPMYLAEAFGKGLEICVPEVWTPFLERAACDCMRFREVSNLPLYKVSESHFVQFEFNALRRFPLIEAIPGHFIGVDPYLIVERTSLGLFYDLFERHGTSFAIRFGHAFDRFIGQILGSVCPATSLWSASEWEQKRVATKRKDHGKIGDWAYVGGNCTVLVECKSLRPSLELTTYGTDESIAQVSNRIAAALEQLIGHSDSILAGKWRDWGLPPGKTACVVVTYGRINTINGPFARRRIRRTLIEKGLVAPPFVVLSLEEFDSMIRVVEQGRPLDELVLALSEQENSFDVVQMFYEELKDGVASSFTLAKGKAFLDSVTTSRRRSQES